MPVLRNRWKYVEVYPESTTHVHYRPDGRTPLEITNRLDVTVQIKYRVKLPWQERFVALDLWLIGPNPVPRWRRAVSRMIRPITRAAVKHWRM